MLIPGTNSYPADVRVIDDGDTCSNAEHSATASDLADRTTWLKTFVDAITSAYTFLVDTTWTIGNSRTLKIKSPTMIPFSAYLDLSEVAGIKVGTNVLGALFNVGAGHTGRANRKPQTLALSSGVTNIDPCTYNTFFVTTSGACSVKITPSGPVAAGDWVEIVNYGTAYQLSVQEPGGGSPVGDLGSLRSSAGSYRSAVYVVDTDGVTWKCLHSIPYSP